MTFLHVPVDGEILRDEPRHNCEAGAPQKTENIPRYLAFCLLISTSLLVSNECSHFLNATGLFRRLFTHLSKRQVAPVREWRVHKLGSVPLVLKGIAKPRTAHANHRVFPLHVISQLLLPYPIV